MLLQCHNLYTEPAAIANTIRLCKSHHQLANIIAKEKLKFANKNRSNDRHNASISIKPANEDSKQLHHISE